MRRDALMLAMLLLAACAEDLETTKPGDPLGGAGGMASGGFGGQGGEGGDGGALPECAALGVPLDTTGLVELAHDDGVPFSSLRQETYAVTASNTYALNDWPVNEAVRFELEHPARIHGFQVMWANVPDDWSPATELAAGLYPDFGHNGFNFWETDPLWEGTRCVADVDDSGVWLSYAFEEPITIEQPGLVYVAHRAEPGSPSWWFDEPVPPGENPCAVFDDCQSAINLPNVEIFTYFHGLSFPFQRHYMVRLWVEYTEEVQPEAKLFQLDDTVPTGAHPSWGDYDNDGFDDLLLGTKLYHNEGDGTFTDSGLGTSITGGVWGDYDNDGCLDFFGYAESYVQPDSLFHNNCAGGFDYVANSGIVDQQSYNTCGDPVNNTASPSAAAAWVDIDADGFLDLYVANFICWEQESFYVDTVFMNDGDGTFTEVTSAFDDTLRLAGRTVVPIDHDGDGDVDIHVGNYRLQRNLLWQNNGDGTMTQMAGALGLEGIANGSYYGHTIGLAWGDIDNDGDFDNVTANLAHPRFFGFSDKTQVFINDGTGHYADNSGDWTYPASDNGLRYQETHSVPALADFDHDGALDLIITAVYERRPTDFYWGNGDGTFSLDAYHTGITAENAFGVSLSDFDNDGDVDAFVTGLYENTGTFSGHWLQTRVVGTTANRAGIGATVRVTSGGVTRMRHVQGGSGKGGQDSLYLNFGLGAATSVDEIRVVFPGGAEVVYPGPIDVDQRVWLVQDSTAIAAGWGPP